jgi:glyoxylase-like metal-dependent hydrolase (beta-lactamase superfamily II)
MRLVVDEAIREADSEPDKAAFRSGRVFANLFERETALVGVAIAAGGNGKQIIVAFPADHFRNTSISALAKEALADFNRSASSRESQLASSQIPEWCKALPRPEYASLERVLPNEPWFEVYKVAPNVFAVYEPHQSEETIAYLIVGTKQALLFDTGMGIADIRAVVRRLTSRPIVVLNSHTHDDHVGGNWQFDFVYGMDTDFTRTNAKGSREDAQAEIAPGEVCGDLPRNFNPKTYATKPWHVSLFVHDGFKINLGGRTLEIIATPGHTPDAICLLDRANGLLFTGDTYYPAPIWLFRPETDLDAYVASVKRIAALAPGLKLVLGAHNVPVASPSVLPRLVEAIEAVRAGKGTSKPGGTGREIRSIDGFSFLMRAQ